MMMLLNPLGSNYKEGQQKVIYITFKEEQKNGLTKSMRIQSEFKKIKNENSKSIEHVEDYYKYDLKTGGYVAFLTKNRCNYFLTDSNFLMKKHVKSIEWVKTSNLITDYYSDFLPFDHIYICEYLGVNTYLVTEVNKVIEEY